MANTLNLFGQEACILMIQHVIHRLSFKATTGLKKRDQNEKKRNAVYCHIQQSIKSFLPEM